MEYSAVSTIWVLLGAALVFFMQAGFAMVETGFTRAKNAGNIIMKNLMDFSLGTPIFWLLGFGLMFGSGKFIGSYAGIADPANYTGVAPDGVPFWAFMIFQTVFCATAATIVSGAMAERTKFSSYLIYSAVISAIVYPIEAHWIWGGGWLSDMGFHDFAGSTAVHMAGGVAAFVGAKILGPRIGKYGKNGEVRAIPGHSLTLGALGCFILWFCWFGFNGCSTVSMDGDVAIESAAKIFVTTNIAAAIATGVTMVFTWIKYGKPDVSMSLNGSLAGLVAITAGCDTVTPVGAAIIGIVAGFAVVLGIEFVDQKLKIDDPVGAVGVHCVNGFLGTILVGLFSDGSGTETAGLFYGGGAKLLGIQALGAFTVIVWVAVLMSATFMIIKKTVGLRASVEEEVRGLDATEHNLESSYADFIPAPASASMAKAEAKAEVKAGIMPPTSEAETVSEEKAVVVEDKSTGAKITRIAIICKQNKLQEMQEALSSIDVTGITVTNVMGYGIQSGHQDEYYRGAKKEASTLLPKVKIEVVVANVPVETVVETARKTLYTGSIGDGKIFIYDVEDVIKVRTGERGKAALIDMNR